MAHVYLSLATVAISGIALSCTPRPEPNPPPGPEPVPIAPATPAPTAPDSPPLQSSAEPAASDGPSPMVPTDWTLCEAPADCVLVVTTCCDQCNGGKAVSVNT